MSKLDKVESERRLACSERNTPQALSGGADVCATLEATGTRVTHTGGHGKNGIDCWRRARMTRMPACTRRHPIQEPGGPGADQVRRSAVFEHEQLQRIIGSKQEYRDRHVRSWRRATHVVELLTSILRGWATA